MLTSDNKLSALIVDDEPLAHQVLLHHLQDQTDIQVVGQCYNATQALQFLASNKVELLFLDINMPALSGMEMLRVLAEKPQVVIVSAYQEYALEGFELDVTDYLLKPVSKERLNSALNKVRKRHEMVCGETQSVGKNKAQPVNHIVLKVGREKRKFVLKDVQYFEAYGNYVKLWSNNKQDNCDRADMTLVNTTIKRLLENLPIDSFVQIHKSFVINKKHVQIQNSDFVQLSCGDKIKIGKAYKKLMSGLLE